MQLDSHAALEAAMQEAEACWSRGDSAAALNHYCRIVAARLDWARRAARVGAVGLGAADMVAVERLADLAVLHGRIEAADELLVGMAMLLATAGNSYGSAYAVLKRLHVALARGDLRAAFVLLANMSAQIGDIRSVSFVPAHLSAWEKRCHWPGTDVADRAVLFSRLYLGMGILLAGLGQYRDAEAALEHGLKHTGEASPDLARRAAIPLRLALATALLERGALDQSEAELRDLEKMIDQPREAGFAAQRIEQLGRIALLRGELGAALEHLAAVDALCRHYGLRRAALYASLNLAHALVLVNQTSYATELLVDASREAQDLGDQAAALRALAILQVARARSHSLGGGLPIASAARQMRGPDAIEDTVAPEPEEPPPLDLPQSAGYLSFFEDRALGFHWLLGRQRFEEASAHLERIRQVFGHSDSLIIQTRLDLLAGLLFYYQGKSGNAAELLAGAVPALREMNLVGDLWQAQRVLGWCWDRLDRPTTERERLAAETAAQLERMTASLEGMARTIFQINKWTADEEYIASEINALARMRREIVTAPWLLRPLRRWTVTRRLAKLLDHIDQYKDRRARSTIAGEKIDRLPQRLSLLRRLLSYPRDRVSIGFLVLPDRVLVTRAGWLQLDFGVCPLTRLQVRDLVRRWHKSVKAAGAGRGLFVVHSEETSSEPPVDERPIIAAQLAAGLQIPRIIAGLSTKVRSLTFVPDDSLHGFPFAALVHEGCYLVERYSVSVTFEQAPPTHPTSRRAPSGLLVGVSKGADNFPALPGARSEIERVDAVLTSAGLRSQVLFDNAATRETVIGMLNQATLAHIAAHGIFTPNQPDNSGIVLSSSIGKNEILSLRDLACQLVDGLRHVTLAACWSADQFVLPGRWVISLPETLWRSGTASVLGSLWEVDDQLSCAFMERFYIYLKQYSGDVALQRTQIDCLTGQLPGVIGCRSRDPRFWACFTLYGDPTILDVAQ